MSPATPNEIEILRSTRLMREGFVHGFPTRRGGVSRGAYASLSFACGKESMEDVAENLRRLGACMGFAPEELFEVSQVHGARVVRRAASEHARGARTDEADAIVVASGAAGVRVADCAPVLLGNVASGEAAAVHAGWRGVVAGVVGSAVRELGEGRKVAAIGPCIGGCCFEVGADVATVIARAAGATETEIVTRRAGEKAFVDLRRAIQMQLGALGLAPDDIENVAGCTKCDRTRFHSFRRDGSESGRHLAVVVARTRG